MMTTTSLTTDNLAEAKRLYRLHTGRTGTIDRLYGPENAANRGEILAALSGRHVPKSRAAWGVFRRAMLELYGVSGGCRAEADRNLRCAAIDWDREYRRPLECKACGDPITVPASCTDNNYCDNCRGRNSQ